jgi:excisionase family DNA binding protein
VARYEPLTYSVPEAAALLGVNRNTAYEAAARGELPTIRIGKRVLVPRAAFEAMLAGARTPSQLAA